jgi:hypothetical protein
MRCAARRNRLAANVGRHVTDPTTCPTSVLKDGLAGFRPCSVAAAREGDRYLHMWENVNGKVFPVLGRDW